MRGLVVTPNFDAGLELEREMGEAFRELRDAGRERAAANGLLGYGLTDPELAAVYAYTRGGDGRWSHRALNAALRSGDRERIDGAQNYKLTLAAALGKLPNHAGPVQRGVELQKAELARYRAGEEIIEEGFTSASLDGGFDSSHRFVIVSKYGKLVEGLSEYPEEREVLFTAGTRFRVSKRDDPGGGQAEITMLEV